MGFKPGKVGPRTTSVTLDRGTPTRASTAVYLNRKGEPYSVFHRSERGASAWEHPTSETCSACVEYRSQS